jgi:hypothetical protein
MRSEAIDFLVRNGQEVTEDNIFSALSSGLNKYVSNDIIQGNVGIDRKLINNIYSFAAGSMLENVEGRMLLEDTYSNMQIDVSERLERLSRDIQLGFNELRTAQVLESSMSGYVKTINVDFGNNTVINQNSTDALISDGIVMGVKAPSVMADMSSIPIREYDISSISGALRSSSSTSGVVVELISDDGITIISDQDSVIINNGAKFSLSAESEFSDSKKLDLLIDKKDTEFFNQIEINLEKAHVAQIYISEDGLEYSKQFEKPRYIKNTIVPVESSKARFIKITFIKNKSNYSHNGKYGYKIGINSLNILKSTIEESAYVETNNMDISGTYSRVAIQTCCSYSDLNAEIKYYISLDDKEWQPIRPVNKTKIENIIDSVSLPLNTYTDNQIISLVDNTAVQSGYRYDLELPGEFIDSNQLRVFEGDITGSGEDWITDQRYYYAVGVLLTPATFDIGQSEMEFNGKWATGEVNLDKGIYRIKVKSEDYANLFNGKNATVISEINGEYVVKDDQGNTKSIFDPTYPHNNKILADTVFDFLFKRELIEKDSYTLYNNGSGYHISTGSNYDEVIVAYRLHQSNANSVKIKAELKSLDKTTIPYIEKLLIRLA